MTNILLQSGAVVNIGDIEGNTPLHLACDSGYADIYEALVAGGGLTELKNKDSKTPREMGYR